jgi:hypothetical protein
VKVTVAEYNEGFWLEASTADGGARGVTVFDGVEGPLIRLTSFVARTVNVYDAPFVSPLTTSPL